MAIRGTEAKEYITYKIINSFEGSFINGKEIRIPYMENGEEVQIKLTLTAAKENVPHDGTINVPTASNDNKKVMNTFMDSSTVVVTEEEKNNIDKLIKELNL